jgi:putative transposase
MIKTANASASKALKRLHYPLDIMLTCVRWYVAYPLSLRHLEEMMSERAVSVDHSIGAPVGYQVAGCAR